MYMNYTDWVLEIGEDVSEEISEPEWVADTEIWRRFHTPLPGYKTSRPRPDKKYRGRKGSIYYERTRAYHMTGIQHERDKIRARHRHKWGKYKRIIAPNSQLHHAWHHDSVEYDGVALVEKDAHQHGIIDVIQILEGEITLLSEKGMRWY